MKFRKIESNQASEGSGKFIRIPKDGFIKGVLRGEVYEFHTKWIDGKSHVVEKNAPGAKSRFRINFVTKEDNKYVAKIYEYGISVQNQFYDLSQDYDLSQTVIKITRRGEKLETEYSVIPLKDEVPQEALKVDLQILEVQQKAESSEPQGYQSKIPAHLRKSKPPEDAPEDLWDNAPAPGDIEEDPLPF